MAAAQESDDFDKSYVYNQLDAYPFDQDEEFQGGLRAILGSAQSPEMIDHLTLRAKCFYYARKSGTKIDFDDYKNWVESNRSVPHTNGVSGEAGEIDPVEVIHEDPERVGIMAEAPKPASFRDLVDMIAEGKPIPGIKDIPDTILEGQASDTKKDARKKPWEKGAEQVEKPSWMT